MSYVQLYFIDISRHHVLSMLCNYAQYLITFDNNIDARCVYQIVPGYFVQISNGSIYRGDICIALINDSSVILLY